MAKYPSAGLTEEVQVTSAPAWNRDDGEERLLIRSGKHDAEYLPSWDWGGEFLSKGHPRILERLDGIEGLMYPEDALKLYELAWFTPGPILEIGTFKGRSAALMSLALSDAENPAWIMSVDIDGDHLGQARENLGRLGAGGRVTLVEGTSTALARRLAGQSFGLVFVDGDHRHRGVSRDIAAIEPLVPVGGILAFHDYEGFEPAHAYQVQVARAVESSWVAASCAFLGRFGLTGVFLRQRGAVSGSLSAGREPPPLISLTARDAALRRWARRKALGLDNRVQHWVGRIRGR
jgi:predicted O-methyltransferase YrrM